MWPCVDSFQVLGYNASGMGTSLPQDSPTRPSPLPPIQEEGRILRASLLISGATLVSRILGFARDIVLARLFGAGLAADAFFVAGASCPALALVVA